MTLNELVNTCGNIKRGKINKVLVWNHRGDYLGEWEGKQIDRMHVFVLAHNPVVEFHTTTKKLEVIIRG